MAHYAKVTNGKVVKVIVAEASFFNNYVDDSPGTWIQTSYNTEEEYIMKLILIHLLKINQKH